MAIKQVISCDVEGCNKVKAEVNHWFKVWISSGEFITSSKFPNVQVLDGVKDVCGAEHAMTLYSRFLSYGTLELHQETVQTTIMPERDGIISESW